MNIRQYLPKDFPKIFCISGSTRFKKEINDISMQLTLNRQIVLGVFIFKDYNPSQEQKDKLFELQLKRIDISDVLFVVNVNNYIGDSVIKEINYAKLYGKQIIYLVEYDVPFLRDSNNRCSIYQPFRLGYTDSTPKCKDDKHILCNICCHNIKNKKEN